MPKDNLIPLPIKYTQILKNRRGKYSVNCLLSDKWLRFGETSTPLDLGEACVVDVMQAKEDDTDERICQLIITKEELLDVLKQIKRRE